MAYVRLNEVAKVINGDRGKNYPSQAELSDEGDFLFVNAGNFKDGEISNDSLKYISEDKYNKLSSGKFCNGDILYCLRGSLGKKAIVRNQIGAIASSLTIIRPDISKITTDYLFFMLESNYISKQLNSCNNGSTQPNLSATNVKEFYFEIPSIKRQEEVVTIIRNIKKCLEIKREQYNCLNELIKSRFIEMFETIDLSEQRSNWKELGLVSKIYTGTTPSTKEPKNWDGDVLWITPAEMNQDTFYVYDTMRKITETGRKSKSLDLMPINTVLLSTRAPIGKVGIVGKPMCCNQGFKNFECSSDVNPVFLYTLLKNNTDYLNSLGSGTTFLEVSKSRISKMLIPVPNIELQKQFESYVKLIDKSKFIVQHQIDDLQELLDLKMQEYFG